MLVVPVALAVARHRAVVDRARPDRPRRAAGRDAAVLRSRGLTALPVTYIGKAATFALMSGFPLILLGQWDALWSRVILALRLGVPDLGHGDVPVVGRAVPDPGGDGGAHHAPRRPPGRLTGVRGRARARRLQPGRRPQRPRGGRAEADPGAVAAAVAAVRPSRPRLRGGRQRRAARGATGRRPASWAWQVAGRPGCRGGVRRRCRPGAVRRARRPGRPSRCSPTACESAETTTDDGHGPPRRAGSGRSRPSGAAGWRATSGQQLLDGLDAAEFAAAATAVHRPGLTVTRHRTRRRPRSVRRVEAAGRRAAGR